METQYIEIEKGDKNGKWPTVGNGQQWEMGNSEEWILDPCGGRGIRTQDNLKFSFGAVVIPLCYREIDDKWLSKNCVVLRNVSE